jgi:hypothetical protein
MLSGDTERTRREYFAHTPLVQSENQSREWGEVHGKRRFSWEKPSKNHGKTA